MVHTWTIGCLIGGFFDLVFAYVLLCVSAFLFLPFKCLSLFGIYLPCSCNSSSSSSSSSSSHNLCLHKLLFDWPVRTVYSVQSSAKNRFPFNFIRVNDQAGFVQLVEGEGEGEGCSRFSESRGLQGFVDAKGKKTMNQKQRGGIRRPRKLQSGYGRVSAVLLDKSLSRQHVMEGGVSGSSSVDFEMSESSERLDPVSKVIVDDGSATEGLHPSERTTHGFEMGVPIEENKDDEKVTSSCDQFSSAQAKTEIARTHMNQIKMLQQALDEEKALCLSVYMELEKERAAAATAADEAMAMIIRLQEEKASTEMELRQYQRMIEEKSAYDEEEVNILKEILVRREKEKHFLEKEVEAYRNMEILENEQSEDGFHDSIDEGNESPKLNQHTRECDLPEKEFRLAMKKGENNNCVECKVLKTQLDDGVEQTNEDFPQSSILETEPAVYDIHVIDDNTDIWKAKNKQADSPLSGSVVCASEISSDCPSTSRSVTKDYSPRCSFEMNGGSSTLEQKDVISNSERNSSIVVNENFKLENEVEWLRERLSLMQQEKQKLTFSSERREKMNAQLQGLMNQLLEIQELGEPEWQAS